MMKKMYERAALIRAVRFFFEKREYLEVETPIRNPVLIPEATILPVSSADYFLQTSPELCMKRLLGAGYNRMFQICKCFRAKERGSRHLPEFTMLEWYRALDDYQGLMAETAELLCAVAHAMGDVVGVDGDVVTLLSKEPEFLTVAEAFRLFSSSTVEQALAGDCFEEVLVVDIEPNLGKERPLFLYDYPVALGSLARRKKTDAGLAERFELYVLGVEVANGFSELTDVPEQRQRFMAERRKAKEGGHDAGTMPEKFLDDLAKMPEACGIALGLDRLIMLVTGAKEIDEVVSFTPEEL